MTGREKDKPTIHGMELKIDGRSCFIDARFVDPFMTLVGMVAADKKLTMRDLSEDEWRHEIVIRDSLDAMTVVSYLSNLLYDNAMASAREARFFEDGGEFALLIKRRAKERAIECRKWLETNGRFDGK